MRLLLIEDSPRLQETLRLGFARAGFAIDVVGDGEQGLTFAKRGLYDVIILDLTLPKLDGFDVLRQLREAGNETHVLILTARHAVEDRVEGLRNGADDYVAKPFSFDELLARVEALVRRQFRSKSVVSNIGDVSIDTAAKCVTRAGREIKFTMREYRILEYLARRCGEIVTRIEIEDHIYGENNLPASNTIESAISTIRKKLRDGGGDGSDPIETRHGIGYCWPVPSVDCP